MEPALGDNLNHNIVFGVHMGTKLKALKFSTHLFMLVRLCNFNQVKSLLLSSSCHEWL